MFDGITKMDFKCEYETFGERNAIEGFNILKARLKRFWKRFPYNASKESVERWLTCICNHYLEVKTSGESVSPQVKIKRLSLRFDRG